MQSMRFTTAALRTGTMAILAALVGVVCALVWANLAVLPSYVVQADGHALIGDDSLAEAFSANFWFSVLAVLGGVAIGIACWIMLRQLGWPVALITAGLSLLAGGTCWVVGELIGPGQFEQRMAAAQPGESVRMALELTTPSALALWVFAAIAVPLFAASLGPDLSPGEEPQQRRRPRDEPDALSDDAFAPTSSLEG
jgi:hypothetical protein